MRPGRAADHSPPSSAAVMEEKIYTSTHPLGHTGPVTGSLYLLPLNNNNNNSNNNNNAPSITYTCRQVNPRPSNELTCLETCGLPSDRCWFPWPALN